MLLIVYPVILFGKCCMYYKHLNSTNLVYYYNIPDFDANYIILRYYKLKTKTVFLRAGARSQAAVSWDWKMELIWKFRLNDMQVGNVDRSIQQFKT